MATTAGIKSKRAERAGRIVAYLKKAYPRPESELHFKTPFQFVVAVMLSAQCTDKAVNKVTRELFKKYKKPSCFKDADPVVFESELSSIPFFRNKAKHIRATAAIVSDEYKGKVPSDPSLLQKMPGIGYKTAYVVVGELYGAWDGIPTDTHVKRFARKFDLSDETDLKKISHDLERLIPKEDWKYVNNGLVLYGRYVCKANKHDCAEHPLTKLWPPAEMRWPRA